MNQFTNDDTWFTVITMMTGFKCAPRAGIWTSFSAPWAATVGERAHVPRTTWSRHGVEYDTSFSPFTETIHSSAMAICGIVEVDATGTSS